MSRSVILWVPVCVALAGCSDGDLPAGPPAPVDAAVPCAPGEMPVGSACQPAGLPKDAAPCPPGETSLAPGWCEPAGVPGDHCADGFAADGARGCRPILPDTCAPGWIARLGATECERIAPCGAAPWGDVEIDANTVFVDASWPGTDSDGSQTKPYKTVVDGLAAAASGATIAIAAGTYVEDVIVDKTVELHGRCPELVTIQGTGAALATLYAEGGSPEIRGIAITGPKRGVELSGTLDALISEVWIHDTGDMGVYVEDAAGPTSAVVRDTLVEAASEIGIFAEGADATLDGVEVRTTQPNAIGALGRGVDAQYDDGSSRRARLTVTGSIVTASREMGIAIGSSDATLTGSLVRDTLASASNEGGFGMLASDEIVPAEPADVRLTGVVIERSRDVGLWLRGSHATLEDSVVAATISTGSDQSGRGLHADVGAAGARAKLEVTRSLVTGSDQGGIVAFGSDVSVDATLVGILEASAEHPGVGRGIYLQATDGERAKLDARDSVLASNVAAGLEVFGSDATLDGVIVRGVMPDAAGDALGMNVQPNSALAQRSAATVTRSIFQDNAIRGVVVVSSDVTLEGVVVSGTLARKSDQLFGRGLEAGDSPDMKRAVVSVRSSLFEANREAAILAQGSDLTLDGVLVRATASSAGAHEGWGFGISVQDGVEPAKLSISWSVIDDSGAFGVLVTNSDAAVDASVVTGTRIGPDGRLGDGVAVTSLGASSPARLTVTGSSIRDNGRAGIANFGAELVLGSTRLECNAIDLDGETVAQPPEFEELGGNVCTCKSAEIACAVQTSSLEPPPHL